MVWDVGCFRGMVKVMYFWLDGLVHWDNLLEGLVVGLGMSGDVIEVVFEEGYGYAQVFAPSIADLVCFEPMTAPADALRHAPDAVAPGESFTARFSVTIVRVSER